MISIDLSGKSILITGALGAIAESMVRKLVEAGATLILLDIKSEDAASQTLRDWKIPPSSYIYFPTDITDSAALARVVTKTFRRFPASIPFSATPEAAGCILSRLLPKRITTVSSGSTISHKLIWPAPSSRTGSSARFPAI